MGKSWENHGKMMEHVEKWKNMGRTKWSLDGKIAYEMEKCSLQCLITGSITGGYGLLLHVENPMVFPFGQ